MKNIIVTTVVALGIALPSLASAMTDAQSVHSDKATVIFKMLADESRDDKS